MFLDYDGTLREIETDPAGATPTPDLVDLLDALAHDDRLDVTIISGRTPQDLQSFLGRYPFGLIAEHGAAFRPPRSGAWEEVDAGPGDWQGGVRDLMRRYAESTPGAFVEEKRTSLVWHYRRADPRDGDRKACRLAGGLSELAAAHPVVVRHGKKIVEVTPAGVNKGTAALNILGGKPDRYALVIVAGDDATDESMLALDVRNMIPVYVGEGGGARYCVPTPAALRDLMRRAIASGGRRGR
jgi:trehalose 6-phosphate synthase/phosphatase